MKQNDVTHKVRLLHHRQIIKLDRIELLLKVKQSEVGQILKNIFLHKALFLRSKTLKAEDHEK